MTEGWGAKEGHPVIGATVKLGRADESGIGGIGAHYPNLGLKSSELLVYLVGLSYNMLLLDSKHY